MRQELIKAWTGPLPPEHIWISLENRPRGLLNSLRVYLRKWIIHPIKRRLAKYYLSFLKTFLGLKVIAITGSAGKTTTKEMLAGILSQDGPTIYSVANIDPVYNIPTTILKCTPLTKYLILEMGIEYVGEMDFYTWLAQPDIAIITNVNLTHTLFLKNLTTVASEKGRIGKFAKDLIINADDENILINTSGNVHKIKASDYDFNLQILGEHLKTNAALAAKAAQLLNVSDNKIHDGLERLVAPPHRLHLIKTAKYTIIDDTYNANPLATKASILTLIEYAKANKLTPVFVFAQMNELGDYEESAHKEIAQLVSEQNIKHFLTHGPANTKHGKHFNNQEDLIAATEKFLTPKYVILVKGSRGWKMENVVAALIRS